MTPFLLPPLPPDGGDLPAAPYPGIRPFKRDEWRVFFGRDTMIDDVVARLAKTQLVVVHGSSGCGKSSLVMAGVLPRLELEHTREGVSWKAARMRPGRTPLWNLAEAIAALVDDGQPRAPDQPPQAHDIVRSLNRGEAALTHLVELHGLGQKGNVCLVLDQFEELFRFEHEFMRAEAEIVSDVLGGFVSEGGPPDGVHAIITMRSDHLGDCCRFPTLAKLINRTHYLLPRMEREALVLAIQEPAKLYRGEVTTDLTLKLLEDSAAVLAPLPLVQHCLMWHWRRTPVRLNGIQVDDEAEAYMLADRAVLWDDGGAPNPLPERVLDVGDYHGLREALSEHAEEIFKRLKANYPDADIERITEYLFRALIDTDANGHLIRRPCRLSKLVDIVGGEPRREALNTIINHLRLDDCGFLTPPQDQVIDDNAVIDIGHEALIRSWHRIDNPRIDKSTDSAPGWLQREEEAAQVFRTMRQRAEDHELLSEAHIDDRERWFLALPGPGWAMRYGGGWDDVRNLISESRRGIREVQQKQRRKEQRKLWWYFAYAAAVLLVATGLDSYYAQSTNEVFDADLEAQRRWIIELQTELNTFMDEKKDRLGETLEVNTTFSGCEGCPKMVVLPAGDFLMGSPASEVGRREREGPLHRVDIPYPFAIGVHEVTFAEWDLCVAARDCTYQPHDQDWGRNDRPVINVSWEDTQEYFKWLKKQTGKIYRLPTEAEWEYAARAATATRYFWGDQLKDNRANCDGCGSEWDNDRTAPVGSFEPNEFGLYDMNGNVWEWVEDTWKNSYEGAPEDGSDYVSDGEQTLRVRRGGAWNINPDWVRSATRSPNYLTRRSAENGFRVATTLPRE